MRRFGGEQRASWPPGRDAYDALERFYTLFGVDVATNPDVEDTVYWRSACREVTAS